MHKLTAHRASRRDLLKAAAAAAGVVTAGSVLSSCAKKGSSGGGEITLKLSDAPFRAMPTAKEQKADIGARSYAHALQKWLDKNPGVKLKTVKIDIWNQEAMVTAAAGGTAPAIYDANTLGGFKMPSILSAFKQGLCAETTEVLERYKFDDLLASYVKPLWQENWKVDGKYFGAAGGLGISDGLFYRRDLLKDAGIAEPTPDWTWKDVRTMSKALTKGKRKGFATPQWGLNVALDSDGFGLFTQLPAPKDNWRWSYDYTSLAKEVWVPGVDNWRKMAFEDKSVLSDISFGSWNEVTAAFVRGDAAIQAGNLGIYLTPAGQDNSYLDMAKQLGKPLEEVVGWMTYPVGDYGQYPARRTFLGVNAFSPDLKDDELDKAVSLHIYMTGEGLIAQRSEAYKESKNLQEVYTGETLAPLFGMVADKLPGSAEEAWGATFMDQVNRAAKRKSMPETSQFLPPEESSGPSDEPVNDAMSKWMYEPGNADIAVGLQKLQDVRNKQAKSFTSKASEEQFREGAKKYFEAQDAFWKEDAPQFHEKLYQPWYEQHVKSALGG